MHPNVGFSWDDREEMLGFVAERAFAHIFTASAAGQYVVHAPLLVADTEIRFHVARRNRISDQLDGRPVLLSILGYDAYQSANWYVSENQVPTWHYEAVEIEGVARLVSEDELIGMIDQLSDVMEHRYSPERPWNRSKMEPAKFSAMLKAVIGFSVTPEEVRGTRKFNQHKNREDIEATIEGQLAAGRSDIASLVKAMSGRA